MEKHNTYVAPADGPQYAPSTSMGSDSGITNEYQYAKGGDHGAKAEQPAQGDKAEVWDLEAPGGNS